MNFTERIAFSAAEVSRYYAFRLPRLRQRGGEWRGACPVHNGKDPNFTVSAESGIAYCHSQCQRGWGIIGLESALSGCSGKSAAIESLKIVGRITGSPRTVSCYGRLTSDGTGDHCQNSKIVRTYDYTDESDDLLYQIVRTDPKGFFQRCPDGRGGWINRKCNRQVLFHLPEVLQANVVFIVEGEKDVETLRAHGFTATTNSGGASAKWLASYTAALVGRDVIIIPDNDLPGRRRAATIARLLYGHAARLRILTVPQPAKDVTDWFTAAHGEVEFLTLLEGASDAVGRN